MSPELVGSLKDAKKVSEYDMLEFAKQQGMVTMSQDGMLKVIEGQTTTEEVFRVAGE